MRLHVYWVVLLLGLLTACDKHSTESLPTQQTTQNPQTEIDPALSPDAYSVYYVSIDQETSERALYRMTATSAKRAKVFTGTIHSSPSVSPDNKRVAFLDQDELVRIYDVGNKTISEPISDQSFQSVLYVNNTNLVGAKDGSLYRIDQSMDKVTYFGSGYDPTYYSSGSFICAVNQFGTWGLVCYTDFEFPGAVLKTVSTSGLVRFPCADRHTDRFCYTIQAEGSYSIRVMGSLNDNRHLQFSSYPRAVMAGADIIIMTGPDGRFYASDFDGTLFYAYLPEGDPEGPAKLTKSD